MEKTIINHQRTITMIEQIMQLLSTWMQRRVNSSNSDYSIAIGECYDELQHILEESQEYKDFMNTYFNNLPSKEMEEYFNDLEADSYLSSMEAHESAA